MSQENDTDTAPVPDASTVAEKRAGEDEVRLAFCLSSLSLSVQAKGFREGFPSVS